MENEAISKRNHPALTVLADVLDDRREVALEVVEPFGDLFHALLERVQSGPDGVRAVRDRFVDFGWISALQQEKQVLGVPAERGGQLLQRAGAAFALHDVVLDLADDRLRDVRALRELPLSPAELVHALVDGLGDRRPVFRHLFLRAPPSRRG